MLVCRSQPLPPWPPTPAETSAAPVEEEAAAAAACLLRPPTSRPPPPPRPTAATQWTSRAEEGSRKVTLLSAAFARNFLIRLFLPPPPCPDPSLSYATRVAPATIQWLVNNYETADGVSLPRSTLYSHYQRHWCEQKRQGILTI